MKDQNRILGNVLRVLQKRRKFEKKADREFGEVNLPQLNAEQVNSTIEYLPEFCGFESKALAIYRRAFPQGFDSGSEDWDGQSDIWLQNAADTNDVRDVKYARHSVYQNISTRKADETRDTGERCRSLAAERGLIEPAPIDVNYSG